jgi:hypothetical protein
MNNIKLEDADIVMEALREQTLFHGQIATHEPPNTAQISRLKTENTGSK